MSTPWVPTACILCSENCGLEVQLEDGHIARVRGDTKSPTSRGYACQKAQRLDHYLHHADRLKTPLRRRDDGSFEEVSWEVAISEIAARLVALRDEHGGHALAYYGGGGQGNHIGGAYGRSLRAAMKTPYYYNALAQEKTGDFWVNGKLFGRQSCHIADSVHDAELVVFIGTNPWQSHGFPRARKVLSEIAADPKRTMVVIDPVRTKTATLADVHLALRPGTDAFFLGALLAILVRDDLVDHDFLSQRTVGYEAVAEQLRRVDIEGWAAHTGIALEQIEDLARRIHAASSVSVRVDLGLQQSLNSTLNSYLEKLLFLLTGNFGRPGTNTLHNFFLPLISHSRPDGVKTAVTGVEEIAALFPPNVLPAEILTDHPRRIRGVVVDSGNPVRTAADTKAYVEAFRQLELLVVIDVAMTETAALAHYVLPASAQFEKWEATFFTLNFPTNAFHLRAPLVPPPGDTLPELEIYRRLLVAMGELPSDFPVLRRVARLDRRAPRARLFPIAIGAALKLRPKWVPYAPIILAETLGATLPDGAKPASLIWFGAITYARKHAAAVRRAGHRGKDLGEALFASILGARSGVNYATHTYEDMWKWVFHSDKRIHLAIPELLAELADLTPAPAHPEWPFTLIAGERRSYNANTIFRSPAWRRSDQEGSLRMNPEDAARLGLSDADRVRCVSAAGSIEIALRLDDALPQGLLSMPHGYGLDYSDPSAGPQGANVNELTSASHCDPRTRTPFHKTVPVRVERL